MLQLPEVEGVLGRTTLFYNLTRDELDWVRPHLKVVECPRGRKLFREHDPSDCLYIVRSGVLRVERQIDASTRLSVASVGSGEVLGEMGLISSAPRTMDGVAEESCTLWKLPKDDFDGLCRDHEHLGAKLLRNIAMVLGSRLNTMNDEVASLFRRLEDAQGSRQRLDEIVQSWSRLFQVTHTGTG